MTDDTGAERKSNICALVSTKIKQVLFPYNMGVNSTIITRG
jgi:hypothetical protein